MNLKYQRAVGPIIGVRDKGARGAIETLKLPVYKSVQNFRENRRLSDTCDVNALVEGTELPGNYSI